MRLLFLSILFLFSINCSASKSKPDSTVYQFGNDTILQTLTIRWQCDSIIEYHLLSQDLMDRGSISAKGLARRRSVPDEPVIKSYLDKEFPAEYFLSTTGDCDLRFYVQYMHKEKVWVERECKSSGRMHKVPMTSVGILEKVN